jgi:hypothetical protein
VKVDPKLGGQSKVPKFGGQWNVPRLGSQWNVPKLVANGRFQSLVANGKEGKNTFSPLPTFPPTILLKPSIFPFDL